MSDFNLGISRSDQVSDTELSVVKFAADNDLQYDLFHNNLDITTKLSIQELLDQVTSGLGLRVEQIWHLSPTTVSVFLSLGKTFLWASHISVGFDAEKKQYSYVFYSAGVAGGGRVNSLINQRILEADEGVEEEPGYYHITVHEFFTKQNVNGVRDLTGNKHILSTRDKLLGLREDTYPYLAVKNMIKSFLSSHENIFLLYGDPGVGKTCLMKLLLRQTAEMTKSGFHAIYVKDKEVLRRPEFWASLSEMSRSTSLLIAEEPVSSSAKDTDDADEDLQFLVGSLPSSNACVYLILDDLDNELGARTKDKDNFIVSQLLSFADGLFENHLKIIITTNQAIDDIDSAIIRPGRCFDVLHLRGLTYEEAAKIWTEGFGLSAESMLESFPDTSASISQAALMSEKNRVQELSSCKDYLLDQSVSVRRSLLQKVN